MSNSALDQPLAPRTPYQQTVARIRREIAAVVVRQRAEDARQQRQQQRQQRAWLLVFLGAAGILLLGIFFAPGPPVQWKMYALAHGLCSQQHTIFLGDLMFPICARNVGIYSSFMLTLLMLWGLGRGRAGCQPPWPIGLVLIGFVALMGVDGVNSLFLDLNLPHLYTPRNDLRTLTGMGMGVTVGVAMLLMFNLALRKDVDEQQPVLQNWRELGGILGLNLLALVAIYGNLELFYWPLATLAFVGISGILYMLSLITCSLMLGYAGSVSRLTQLARPATLAIIPTALFMGSLASMRFWLEAQGLVL